jgi:hypothetical protein
LNQGFNKQRKMRVANVIFLSIALFYNSCWAALGPSAGEEDGGAIESEGLTLARPDAANYFVGRENIACLDDDLNATAKIARSTATLASHARKERVDSFMLALATRLRTDLANSLDSVGAEFPGLTEDSIDLFRNGRIVSIGDSTVNYFYVYGIIPVLALFEASATHNATAVLQNQSLEKAWDYLSRNNLVFTEDIDITRDIPSMTLRVDGIFTMHRVHFPKLNTTVTHYRYMVCKHFDAKLVELIMSNKPTIFLFSLGLHLLHVGNTSRVAGTCAQQLWIDYELWVQHIVRATAAIPTRVYITTTSVGDTEFRGDWKLSADALRKDPGAFIDQCCLEKITSKA